MPKQVFGDPEGKHLSFWFHGTPSCRLEAHGLEEGVLKQLSIKVCAACCDNALVHGA